MSDIFVNVQVSEKLRAAGIKCDLVTGNERDIVLNATHKACTVEMAALNENIDVAGLRILIST